LQDLPSRLLESVIEVQLLTLIKLHPASENDDMKKFHEWYFAKIVNFLKTQDKAYVIDRIENENTGLIRENLVAGNMQGVVNFRDLVDELKGVDTNRTPNEGRIDRHSQLLAGIHFQI
jgi:hypothetical protein